MISFLKFYCLLASLATVSAATYGNNNFKYCSKTCKDSFNRVIPNVGCNHTNSFNSLTCPTNAQMVPIEYPLKQFLVDGHNEKRNFIAGGGHANHSAACRMATMKWDDDLAELASFNVRQCFAGHDKCLGTPSFEFAGQNIILVNGTAPIIFNETEIAIKAVVDWYNEVEHSTQAYIDRFPSNYQGPKIGHFIQLMGEINTHLGCAAANYTIGMTSYFLLTCDYAIDNVVGATTYAKCDTPAIKCSTGPNYRDNYPNLCSEEEYYEYKW